jgi:molybdopterin converting factor small subunit
VKVTVKMGAPLSQVVGESKITLRLDEGATAETVLVELGNRCPDFEAGLRGKGLRVAADRVVYSLFVNSRPVPFDQAPVASLQDGDRLYLFLPVAGG